MQTAEAEWASVNRRPSFANRSMLGVCTFVAPYQHKTYVYHSDNPLKFELENEVAVLDAHAPEIFQDEAGDWFISSVEWPHWGVSIARLVWK